MLGLNLCIVILTWAFFSASRVIWSRLRQPRERRQLLSSHVPSVTKSFWAETLFSWTIAMKHPKDLLPCFMDLIKKNGPVVHFNLFDRSYVLLNDPDDLKVLLSSKENIDKGPEYEMLKPWLNDGLLSSSGTKWRNRRKLFANTFHHKTLDTYNSSINKNSHVLAKKLLAASANNKISNVMEYVTLCSLDIIGETIMGTNMKTQEGKSLQYVKSITKVCTSLIDRVFKFWFWNDSSISSSGQIFHKSVKVLHEYTDNVIEKKRMSINNENNPDPPSENAEYEKPKENPFLDKLISVLKDYPDQMTDKDIREEVDTFFFAGFNKSSIAITMTLLLLGMHQEVQDCARDELHDIFGDSNRDVTMEDLTAMKYVDAVVKESLRLYPSVPHITRTLRETLKLKNYTIPPMTIVAIYPYILHRNEDIYPNPEKFIPERFLDEANKSKFQFGYLPFSAGARDCIGKKFALNEIKIVVSNVLRKAKIETFGSKEDIHVCMEIITRIESIPKMKFFEI